MTVVKSTLSQPSVEEWFREYGTQLGIAILASAGTLGAVATYGKFLKRFPTSETVPIGLISRKGWVKGVVTSVGDADNFRLYHTPGPLLLWRLSLRQVPSTTKGLQNQTLHIRIAGADAPEAAHFGRPKQPYSEEALAWLKSKVEGKRVYCQLAHRDQYGRLVSNVHLSPRILPGALFTGKNLSYEMIRDGWATTYLQSGAEYGKIGKEAFLEMQTQAQVAKRGMWVKGVGKVETPAEYKKRLRMGDKEAQTESIDAKPKGSFWSRLLPWRG